MQKNELRQLFLAQRKRMPPEVWQQRNRSLQESVSLFLSQSSFKKFFLFHGFNNEPTLLQPGFCLGLRQVGDLYLPVVDASDYAMEFYMCSEDEPFVKNRYGILEPNVVGKTPATPDDETIIFVPALAVDRQGHRLGFGKGYYDRYLARFPKAFTAALVFSDFLVPNLPHDSFDVPVSKVICDV